MTKFLLNLKTLVLILSVWALSGCNKSDGEEPQVIIDPVEPVMFDKASAFYYGYSVAQSSDRYVLCLSTSDVEIDEDDLAGNGLGLCATLYAPTAPTPQLSEGFYNVRKPLEMSYLFKLDPQTSYLLISGKETGIAGGELRISISGTDYSVAGELTDDEGNPFYFEYSGVVSLEDKSFGPYNRAVIAEALYFRDMMDEKYDNWSLCLGEEGVTLENLSFDGEGMGFGFDLYAPLAANPVVPVGVYQVATGEASENKEYKFMPGEDYGGSMLTGSYIWIKAKGDTEPTYVYIRGGKLTITERGGVYTILAEVVGDDGKDYNLKYIGDPTVYDPLGGLL